MDKKGKTLKEDYQWQARGQHTGKPLTSRLEIHVKLFFGRRGTRDWDNFHKLSMDALSGIVWEDDEQIDIAHVEKHFDKENPRIEIEVHELAQFWVYGTFLGNFDLSCSLLIELLHSPRPLVGFVVSEG